MKIFCYWITTLLLTVSFAVTASAKTSTCAGLNVTITVYDTDSVGQPTLMGSDDYNGLGQASYSCLEQNSLRTNIYNGILFLDLYSQSIRTLLITPNDPINNQQPLGPPAGQYSQYVEMTSKCFDQNLNLVPLQNVVNTSSNCFLAVDFGSGGVKYKLAMGPSLPAPGPATGTATVTCNAVSGAQCVNWTITPTNSPAVANLYYYAKGGKLTFIGQYFNTYRIGMTNP